MGLTIAVVFNDTGVRKHCLDRSLEAYRGPVPVQLVAVDNTGHAFASAGAALNHAVRTADHDVVVLVHQDVYLHSIDVLASAAAALDDPRWGVLGASGVSAGGEWIGRLRDRVILNGVATAVPMPVDTLDEVLFMARRQDLLDEPLSEDPQLAWHAYAVEYCLRVRRAGRLAGGIDCAITHNSLTVNLARLAEAHQHVAELYPDLLPVRTTCGVLTRRGGRRLTDRRGMGFLRGRRTWWRQTRSASRVRAATGLPVVLADIAHEVDRLDFGPGDPLHLVNIDRTGAFVGLSDASVTLERRGRPVLMSTVSSPEEVPRVLAGLARNDRVLVTDLLPDDLAAIASTLTTGDWSAGVEFSGRIWLLGGPGADQPGRLWSHRAAGASQTC